MCLLTNIPTYQPTNLPTYLTTYLPTYIHTYIHTYLAVNTYITLLGSFLSYPILPFLVPIEVRFGMSWSLFRSVSVPTEVRFGKSWHRYPTAIGVSRLTETDRNGPKRTHENTETDFYGYRNGPELIPDFSGYRNGQEQTSAHTTTNFSMVEKVGWGTIGTILIRYLPTYPPTRASSNQSTIYLTVTYLPTCKHIPTYLPSYLHISALFYLLYSPLLSYITLHIVVPSNLP